jgi:uncharacterized protein (TIGR02271 family)
VERIQKGMAVYSSDGERLGKVVAVREETIVVEKGFFFPTDYTCRVSDIASVRGDEVILRLAKAELQGDQRRDEGEDRLAGERSAIAQEGSTQDVRVPVTEEQLEVQKRGRKAGEVRVSKRVRTEEKQVTVPVTREEVRVERVPAGREASSGEAGFSAQDVSVPVMEEEVVVQKRPVVREEVRISKQSRREEQPVRAQVRKEEVEVEDDTRSERGQPWTEDPDARH